MPLTEQQQVAVNEAAKCAVTAEGATGCPAALTLAQWALESSYGTRCSGRNNVFGIKAIKGEPFEAVRTSEFIHGQHVSITQNFAVYPSLAVAFVEHGTLLTKGQPYVDAFRIYRASNNLPAFIEAVARRYATDPDYAHKLNVIIQMPAIQQALHDAQAEVKA